MNFFKVLMELNYQCCVAMCNPNWKQGKTQGNNEMKKKIRIGKEKCEKNGKKDGNNEKIGRSSKKKKTFHLLTMTFRCERQRCDKNVQCTIESRCGFMLMSMVQFKCIMMALLLLS